MHRYTHTNKPSFSALPLPSCTNEGLISGRLWAAVISLGDLLIGTSDNECSDPENNSNQLLAQRVYQRYLFFHADMCRILCPN